MVLDRWGHGGEIHPLCIKKRMKPQTSGIPSSTTKLIAGFPFALEPK